MFNALTFDEKLIGAGKFSRLFFAGRKPIYADGVDYFQIVDEDFNGKLQGNVYLASVLLDDRTIDNVIDHALSNKVKVIISACRTLAEVGTCDKRYGVTPIGLAHKFGLLDNAYVSGCVYVDKDDIDLINQSKAKIILTPSTSMGLGEGIPPARMMMMLGATVHLGTGLENYNPDGDLEFEKRLLNLAVSGALCSKDAISETDAKKMLKYS